VAGFFYTFELRRTKEVNGKELGGWRTTNIKVSGASRFSHGTGLP
jgi:hypothetical protein